MIVTMRFAPSPRLTCARRRGRAPAAVFVPALVLLVAASARATGSCEHNRCDYANAVAIDSGGRIVLAGRSDDGRKGSEPNVAVWRLDDDGAPDVTFGDGGIVLSDATVAVAGILVAGDGTIVVPSVEFQGVVLRRFGPDGSAIGTRPRSGDGRVETGFIDTSSTGISAANDRFDGIVVADSGPPEEAVPGSRPVLRRFLADGSEDGAFAAAARAPSAENAAARSSPIGTPLPPGTRATGSDIAIDNAGRIVVAGTLVFGGTDARPALWRFLPDGTPDTAFGDDGMVTRFPTEIVCYDAAAAVAVDNTGRVFVAGGTHIRAPSNDNDEGSIITAVAVWCFTPNGVPDESFGYHGLVARNPGATSTVAVAVRTDRENRVVVLSWPQDYGPSVSRYLPDGTPDESFGEDGMVRAADLLPEAGLLVTAIAVDTSDRIVLAGLMWDEFADSDMGVCRLNSDGSLDTSFGTDGVVSYDRLAGFGSAE